GRGHAEHRHEKGGRRAREGPAEARRVGFPFKGDAHAPRSHGSGLYSPKVRTRKVAICPRWTGEAGEEIPPPPPAGAPPLGRWSIPFRYLLRRGPARATTAPAGGERQAHW